jgi:hypothetical protein
MGIIAANSDCIINHQSGIYRFKHSVEGYNILDELGARTPRKWLQLFSHQADYTLQGL